MAKKDVKVRKAYRQGELLFVPLSEQDVGILDPNPNDGSYTRWKKLPTSVLREGEATGHKHEVVTRAAGTATLLAPERQFIGGLPDMDFIGGEDRLLVADEPVRVVHPEHKPLRLPKGSYLVVVQREYDEVRARRVRD